MANQRAGQGKQKAYRLRFNFWLDITKPEEELIADKIEVLKNDRGFTAAIRDGIRLICDLKNGKLDVLFELFPWVRAEFLEYMREVAHDTQPPAEPDVHNGYEDAAPQPSPPQIEAERAWLKAEQERIEQERAWEQHRREEAQKALEAEKQAIEQERKRIEAERQQSQSAMQRQLDRLEELLLQQGNVPIQANGSGDGLQPITLDKPRNPSGPKTLNVPQFSTPPFDDDEEDTRLEVKRDKAAGDIAVQNFLKSAMGLQDNIQQ